MPPFDILNTRDGLFGLVGVAGIYHRTSERRALTDYDFSKSEMSAIRRSIFENGLRKTETSR
jgi:hypothetical protein